MSPAGYNPRQSVRKGGHRISLIHIPQPTLAGSTPQSYANGSPRRSVTPAVHKVYSPGINAALGTLRLKKSRTIPGSGCNRIRRSNPGPAKSKSIAPGETLIFSPPCSTGGSCYCSPKGETTTTTDRLSALGLPVVVFGYFHGQQQPGRLL